MDLEKLATVGCILGVGICFQRPQKLIDTWIDEAIKLRHICKKYVLYIRQEIKFIQNIEPIRKFYNSKITKIKDYLFDFVKSVYCGHRTSITCVSQHSLQNKLICEKTLTSSRLFSEKMVNILSSTEQPSTPA